MSASTTEFAETIQLYCTTNGEAELPKTTRHTFVILGPGNVGLSLACWLEKKGHKAIVYVPPERRHKFYTIWNAGGGALKSKGHILGDDQLYHPEIVHQLSDALARSDVLVQTIPAHQREGIEQQLSGHDLSNHTMFTIPDKGTSLREEARKLLKPRFIVGLSTSPYACRVEDGMVFLKAQKLFLEVSVYQTMRANRNAHDKAALDADLNHFPLDKVRVLLGDARIDERPNALVIDLSSAGPQMHLPAAVFNIGAIQNPEIRFKFYAQGMSDGVLGNTEKADDATIAIGKTLGFDIRSLLRAVNLYYATNFKTLRHFAALSYPHNVTFGDPQDLEHRYFTEDGERAKFRAALAMRLAIPDQEDHIDNLKILYKPIENARRKDFPGFDHLLAIHGLNLPRHQIIEKYGANGYLNTPKLITP